MNIKKWFTKATTYLDLILKIAGFVSSVILIIGFVSSFLAWGNKGVFKWLGTHTTLLWLITLTLVLFLFLFRLRKLYKRFVRGFSENFSSDLRKNWDYVGPWRITDDHALLVTGSDEGGVTKIGAYWENYTLTFKAFIMNDCIGVIVRALDLNNYYMLQIRKDCVRPHRRVAIPEFRTKPKTKQGDEEEQTTLELTNYKIGWQIFERNRIQLSKELNDWFDVRIVVRGESIMLYLDEVLVFQEESFLKNSSGKIGFRNSGEEKALVKNVRVILHH